MDFGLKEARALIADPVLWPRVRAYLASGGEFRAFPKGPGRIALADGATRRQIALWREGLAKADGWRKVVDGAQVRALREAYPGVYPEIFRYMAYFERFRPLDPDSDEVVMLLLKLRFPEVYALCSS